MKILTRGLMVVLLTVAVARAQSDFGKSMTPAEAAAAGMDRISPVERAQLEALVARFKEAAVAAALRQAGAPDAATRHDAETRAAAAESQARIAEARAAEAVKAAEAVATAAKADAVAAKEREKKTEESWAAKVRDLLKTSAPASVVETSLDGTFDGWSKGTIFQFANGQRWQVTDGNYVTPPERGPKKVRIVPTSFGGYFLEIEGAKVRAKARLIGGQN